MGPWCQDATGKMRDYRCDRHESPLPLHRRLQVQACRPLHRLRHDEKAEKDIQTAGGEEGEAGVHRGAAGAARGDRSQDSQDQLGACLPAPLREEGRRLSARPPGRERWRRAACSLGHPG